MEFDKNTQTISDEARRIAETKQVTLQPIHGDVTPEDRPDAEIVANHMSAPPIANASNDTEQTAPLIQPSRELDDTPPSAAPDSKVSPVKITIAVGVVIVCAALFFLTQSA